MSRLRHDVAMRQDKQNGKRRFEADFIERELAFHALVGRRSTKYDRCCSKSIERLLPAADI